MSPRASFDFVAAARSYMGTPFRHMGRSRTGLDCIGLVVVSCRDLGLAVVDARSYDRRPNYRQMLRAARDQFEVIPKSLPLPAGAVAMFRDADWIHVGIATGEGRFIHARGPLGPRRVVEHLIDDQSWGPRIVGAFMHPELV